MTQIFVTFHHAAYGLCKETFKEVYRIVDGVEKYPDHPKYFNKMTDYTNDWYTVYPSQGYWENCNSVREDIQFSICDKSGEIIYFEDSKDYMYIKKYIEERGIDFAIENNLTQYAQWKDALCDNQEFEEYKGYKDNWLYCSYEQITKPVVLKEFSYLGVKYKITKETNKHKFCGIVYDEYEIVGGDYQFSIGYQLVEKENNHD